MPTNRFGGYRKPVKRGTRISAGFLLGVFPLAAQTLVITEYPIPTAHSVPQGICAGPDGNLWFTELSNIGRITPAGTIAEFPLPIAGSGAGGIVAGADGNMWFIGGGPNKIGRITTAGVITEFAISSGAVSITAGPDGNVWFTQPSASSVGGQIGRITPADIVISGACRACEHTRRDYQGTREHYRGA